MKRVEHKRDSYFKYQCAVCLCEYDSEKDAITHEERHGTKKFKIGDKVKWYNNMREDGVIIKFINDKYSNDALCEQDTEERRLVPISMLTLKGE